MRRITVLFPGTNLRQRQRETILHPPAEIIYKTQKPIREMSADYKLSFQQKKNKKLQIARVLRIPNIRKLNKKDLKKIDLVHTPGHMLINNIPYVIEIDNVSVLGLYNAKTITNPISNFLIKSELKSDKCKALICISEAAAQSVKNTFRDIDITKKCVVVYPYIKRNRYTHKTGNKVRFLFISTNFYVKGGKETINAFKRAYEKNKNIELWIVTKLSRIDKQDLREYNKLKFIKFFEANKNKNELYKDFYAKSDVFVLPTYQDSFGLVFLEALASGLPIITTDMFAVPEMVENNKNGYLIKRPFDYFFPDFTPNPNFFGKMDITEYCKEHYFVRVEEELYDKILKLAGDKQLRDEMSKHSIRLLKTKFSEKKRKETLKKVYLEAVK